MSARLKAACKRLMLEFRWVQRRTERIARALSELEEGVTRFQEAFRLLFGPATA
ncbi:hypothetical protein EDD90_7441 [Streptomyces sp. Ag109_O5-1]|nr:hypothetical protein EDD90_7441 [Streptomyces sp. Ag109_O5-1]